MSLFCVFATLIILLNFHMTFTSAKPDSDWLPMSFQHPFPSRSEDDQGNQNNYE